HHHATRRSLSPRDHRGDRQTGIRLRSRPRFHPANHGAGGNPPLNVGPEITAVAEPPRAPARGHPNRALLYTLIGLMQLFWSANFLIGKIALRHFPAPLVAGLRITIAAAAILPFYWWKVHGRGHWTRRDLPTLLMLGLIGVTINQFFFTLGLSKTSVAHSALIIGMTPISVLLIGAARGLERITPRK